MRRSGLLPARSLAPRTSTQRHPGGRMPARPPGGGGAQVPSLDNGEGVHFACAQAQVVRRPGRRFNKLNKKQFGPAALLLSRFPPRDGTSLLFMAHASNRRNPSPRIDPWKGPGWPATRPSRPPSPPSPTQLAAHQGVSRRARSWCRRSSQGGRSTRVLGARGTRTRATPIPPPTACRAAA